MRSSAAPRWVHGILPPGWLSGLLGVLIFSGSIPATKVAVLDFDPWFLTFARGSIAGLAAAAVLLVVKSRWPSLREAISLLLIAAAIVLAFPLLTAFALQGASAAHGVVLIGVLPLATAIAGAVLDGERLPWPFWFWACLGSALVIGFAANGSNGGSTLSSDCLLLLAALICGLGYAQGARMSAMRPAIEVISWSLVLCLPAILPLAFLNMPRHWPDAVSASWAALAYVSFFSMLVGFIFWYRGLAEGGVAGVSQLQLLQPFGGLAISVFLLGEPVSTAAVGTAAAVLFCIVGAQRSLRSPPQIAA